MMTMNNKRQRRIKGSKKFIITRYFSWLEKILETSYCLAIYEGFIFYPKKLEGNFIPENNRYLSCEIAKSCKYMYHL